MSTLAEDDNINVAFLIGKPFLPELAILNHTECLADFMQVGLVSRVTGNVINSHHH